ncbi:Uncharacterized protein TCM_031971 [Theobroma cacao]|uniref:Uncharacterized protein n=1 Tax=Theobroma cacao TaxID=3641 RepID=A0A061FG06_THECC|nr:Uncharacterized protein TCM_031971 [Theobroma cacao]
MVRNPESCLRLDESEDIEINNSGEESRLLSTEHSNKETVEESTEVLDMLVDSNDTRNIDNEALASVEGSFQEADLVDVLLTEQEERLMDVGGFGLFMSPVAERLGKNFKPPSCGYRKNTGLSACIGSGVRKGDRKCGLGNIYVPNEVGARSELRLDLIDKLRDLSFKWCIGGDFNAVMNSRERSSGLDDGRSSVDFVFLIDAIQMINMPMGRLVDNLGMIKEEVANFYEDLYSGKKVAKLKELNCSFKTLSKNSANQLEKPFSTEEV